MPTASTTLRSSNPITVFVTSNLFLFFLRIVLGGLFLFSSFHKIQSPEEFAISIRAYKMLPIGLTSLFALSIAWTEAIAGIMLILGVMTRKAAAAILLLLVVFTIAIIATIARGLAIDCGCFSNEGGSQTSYALVIRNLFLIAAAVIVVAYDRGFWSLSNAFSRKRA